MKIHIHTMYFLPEFGSAPILMNELAADLARRGREVEVVTTLPRPPQNRGYEGRLFVRETRDGFRIIRFPTNFTAHHIGRLIAWTVYTLATWINLVRVKRGDVVFLRLPPLQLGLTGWLARRLRGARVILNVQDIHPDLSIQSGLLRNPFLIKAAQAFEKGIYRMAEEILVISDGFRRNLLAKGVPDRKIRILPNWVDTDILRPRPKDNPVARRFGLADKFVLMYSGTISISSSATLERILEAADRVRDDADPAHRHRRGRPEKARSAGQGGLAGVDQCRLHPVPALCGPARPAGCGGRPDGPAGRREIAALGPLQAL